MKLSRLWCQILCVSGSHPSATVVLRLSIFSFQTLQKLISLFISSSLRLKLCYSAKSAAAVFVWNKMCTALGCDSWEPSLNRLTQEKWFETQDKIACWPYGFTFDPYITHFLCPPIRQNEVSYNCVGAVKHVEVYQRGSLNLNSS